MTRFCILFFSSFVFVLANFVASLSCLLCFGGGTVCGVTRSRFHTRAIRQECCSPATNPCPFYLWVGKRILRQKKKRKDKFWKFLIQQCNLIGQFRNSVRRSSIMQITGPDTTNLARSLLQENISNAGSSAQLRSNTRVQPSKKSIKTGRESQKDLQPIQHVKHCFVCVCV